MWIVVRNDDCLRSNSVQLYGAYNGGNVHTVQVLVMAIMMIIASAIVHFVSLLIVLGFVVIIDMLMLLLLSSVSSLPFCSL